MRLFSGHFFFERNMCVGFTMKQNRTFVCGGYAYCLTIQYQDPISPQNQIDMAYEARCAEYAQLSDSLTQAQDKEEQLQILERMDAVFELLQALRNYHGASYEGTSAHSTKVRIGF